MAIATSDVRWRPSERSRSTFGSAKPPGNFQRDVTAISSCVSGKKTLIFLYETLRQLQLKTLSFKKALKEHKPIFCASDIHTSTLDAIFMNTNLFLQCFVARVL